ncbi:DUF397 domain-containing protein [Nocardia flavorosea]|uniref:DUF397 domain-containing protein n=1 Tax=Nocardia flavorosea TaxID=53429 RepID=UPI0024560A63|nr:DUF397 domain-containing protein [Nocardia flavorosea]
MSTAQTVEGPRSGWFKSSKSNDGPACVEVKFDADRVQIRDSKYRRDPANNPADAPTISIDANQWQSFLDYVASGRKQTPNDDCPAIEYGPDGAVVLRAPSPGPALAFTPQEWSAFVAGVGAQEFDLFAA